MDYRSPPASTAQGAPRSPSASGPNLTINAGEGERLNLPWFIRGPQNWINGY